MYCYKYCNGVRMCVCVSLYQHIWQGANTHSHTHKMWSTTEQHYRTPTVFYVRTWDPVAVDDSPCDHLTYDWAKTYFIWRKGRRIDVPFNSTNHIIHVHALTHTCTPHERPDPMLAYLPFFLILFGPAEDGENEQKKVDKGSFCFSHYYYVSVSPVVNKSE